MIVSKVALQGKRLPAKRSLLRAEWISKSQTSGFSQALRARRPPQAVLSSDEGNGMSLLSNAQFPPSQTTDSRKKSQNTVSQMTVSHTVAQTSPKTPIRGFASQVSCTQKTILEETSKGNNKHQAGQ
jgi:hypothetical protein